MLRHHTETNRPDDKVAGICIPLNQKYGVHGFTTSSSQKPILQQTSWKEV